MTDFYAKEVDGAITELQLGPATVKWHSFEGTVNIDIIAAGKKVTVYSSRTGRSLRVFRDHRELG